MLLDAHVAHAELFRKLTHRETIRALDQTNDVEPMGFREVFENVQVGCHDVSKCKGSETISCATSLRQVIDHQFPAKKIRREKRFGAVYPKYNSQQDL